MQLCSRISTLRKSNTSCCHYFWSWKGTRGALHKLWNSFLPYDILIFCSAQDLLSVATEHIHNNMSQHTLYMKLSQFSLCIQQAIA